MMYGDPQLKNDAQLSVNQEPNIEYEDTIHYVSVESKSRDLNAYPQPEEYRIVFGSSFRNVKSIELIGATLPDQNSVTQEPYLILKINEITNYESSDINIDNAFSILQLKPPVVSGEFLNIDTYICSGSPKIFKTPLARLDRMTISIRNYDNNLFSFGDDTAGSPPNKQYQNMFLFKIITQDKKRNILEHRNVY